MRLPRDPELPAGLKTLSRLQFIHGFVVVAVATAIWLPSPTVAQSWVTLVALLTFPGRAPDAAAAEMRAGSRGGHIGVASWIR